MIAKDAKSDSAGRDGMKVDLEQNSGNVDGGIKTTPQKLTSAAQAIDGIKVDLDLESGIEENGLGKAEEDLPVAEVFQWGDERGQRFHWLSLILTLFLWVSLVVFIAFFAIKDTRNAYIAQWVLVAAAILYLLEGFLIQLCSSSGLIRDLYSHLKTEEAQAKMKVLRESVPTVTFQIECYHYETVRNTTVNANGQTTTQTRRRKVVTHRAAEALMFATWEDKSTSTAIEHFGKVDDVIHGRNLIMKYDIKYTWSPADLESKVAFELQRKRFLLRERRDQYQDVKACYSLSDQQIHNITIKTEAAEINGMLTVKAYTLCTLLGLSWPYRMYIEWRAIDRRRWINIKHLRR